jgi:hypothetical protein
MAAGLPRAPKVTWLELTKFLRGEAPHLDIEELSGHAMQISGQQLRDMLCTLYGKPLGAEGSGKFGTKPKMCAEIRRMMVAGAVPDLRFQPVYPKAAALAGGGAAAPAPAPPAPAEAEEADEAEEAEEAEAEPEPLLIHVGAAEAEARADAAEAELAATKAELAALKAQLAAIAALVV